jgi:hypothetical protein
MLRGFELAESSDCHIELEARFDGTDNVVHVAWADNRDVSPVWLANSRQRLNRSHGRARETGQVGGGEGARRVSVRGGSNPGIDVGAQ